MPSIASPICRRYVVDICRRFNVDIVDMYAKIESEHLLFIRLNQTKLHSEQCIHLRDAVVNDGNTTNVGRLTILPSLYAGSLRTKYIWQNYFERN